MIWDFCPCDFYLGGFPNSLQPQNGISRGPNAEYTVQGGPVVPMTGRRLWSFALFVLRIPIVISILEDHDSLKPWSVPHEILEQTFISYLKG